MKTTDFKYFLLSIQLENYNEIYELAWAAEDGEADTYYEVSDDGEKRFIKSISSGVTLALLSEKARKAFINKLEDEYMDGFDKESYWGYKHALERSDEEDRKLGY